MVAVAVAVATSLRLGKKEVIPILICNICGDIGVSLALVFTESAYKGWEFQESDCTTQLDPHIDSCNDYNFVCSDIGTS